MDGKSEHVWVLSILRLCDYVHSFTHAERKARERPASKIVFQTRALRPSQSENQKETIYSTSRPLAQGYHEHG